MEGEYHGVHQDLWDRRLVEYSHPPPPIRVSTLPVEVEIKVEQIDDAFEGLPPWALGSPGEDNVHPGGRTEVASSVSLDLDPSAAAFVTRLGLGPLSQPLRLPTPPQTPLSPIESAIARPLMTAPSVPSITPPNTAGVATATASPAPSASREAPSDPVPRQLFVSELGIPTTFHVLGDDAGTGLASYLIKVSRGFFLLGSRSTPLGRHPLTSRRGLIQTLSRDSAGSSFPAIEPRS
jgi:hypothetical protein